MATLNDCEIQDSLDQEIEYQDANENEKDTKTSASNLIQSNSKFQASKPIQVSLNSNQSNKAEFNENGKMISIGPVNCAKLTGKLVAVRKDGKSYTSYTFKRDGTASLSTNSTPAKTTTTYTLATPSKANTALITVSSVNSLNSKAPNQFTLSNGKTNGTLIANTSTPQRFYLKTTGNVNSTEPIPTITSTNNSTQQTTRISAINGDSSSKINNSKPIILQMKRKIQVLNDENRKTARFFTIPNSNLINKPNTTNQFIVMNRSLIKPNLVTNNNLIKPKQTTTTGSKLSIVDATLKTATIKTTRQLSISTIDNSSTNKSSNFEKQKTSTQSQNRNQIEKSKTALISGSTNETAVVSIVSKHQIQSSNNSIGVTKIETKLDTKNLYIDKLDLSSSTTSSKQSAGDQHQSTIEKNSCSSPLQLIVMEGTNSGNNLSKTNSNKTTTYTVEEIDAKNLFIDDNLTETITEEVIESLPVIMSVNSIENCFEDVDNLETEIENLIETTIEKSLDRDTDNITSRYEKNTCVNRKLANESNSLKLEQDIEFYSAEENKEEEASLSLNLNDSSKANDCLESQFIRQK